MSQPTLPISHIVILFLLQKPSAETSWGVMPGTDTRGHVLVHALSPLGTAKEQLQVGDRIRAIDGTRVRNETDFVTRLNDAFERANGTQGPTLALTRALPVHSRANKPAAKAAVSAPAPAQTPPARPATLSSEAAAPESQSPRVGGVQAEFVWIGVTGELRSDERDQGRDKGRDRGRDKEKILGKR